MDTSVNLCASGNIQRIPKCALCKKFLSVAPIYRHELGLICGRWQCVNKIEVAQVTRVTLCESLVKFLDFPCSNVTYGCKAQLKCGRIEEHENSCLYEEINCPFVNDDIFQNAKCKWTGSGSGLDEHLENLHADQIQSLPKINFAEIQHSCIFLTKIAEQLMIVTIKRETPETFHCLVMVSGASTDCDGYRYQIEFTDENKKNSVILRRSRLEDAVAFDQNLINAEKAIVVEMPVMKSLLNNSDVVIGRFVIKKSKKSNLHDSIDDNLFGELECPMCRNYMVPPIMICSRGHSFCVQCEEQMNECPTCRRPFHEGRNHILEKLSTNINYPCLYRDAGCMVAGPGKKMKEHEQGCAFRRRSASSIQPRS